LSKRCLRTLLILFLLLFLSVGMAYSADVPTASRVPGMVVMSVSDQSIAGNASALPAPLKELQLPFSGQKAYMNVNILSNTTHGFSLKFSMWTSFPLAVSWKEKGSVYANMEVFSSVENGLEKQLIDVPQNSLENLTVAVSVNAVDDKWYDKETGRYGMTMSFLLVAK